MARAGPLVCAQQCGRHREDGREQFTEWLKSSNCCRGPLDSLHQGKHVCSLAGEVDEIQHVQAAEVQQRDQNRETAFHTSVNQSVVLEFMWSRSLLE